MIQPLVENERNNRAGSVWKASCQRALAGSGAVRMIAIELVRCWCALINECRASRAAARGEYFSICATVAIHVSAGFDLFGFGIWFASGHASASPVSLVVDE